LKKNSNDRRRSAGPSTLNLKIGGKKTESQDLEEPKIGWERTTKKGI